MRHKVRGRQLSRDTEHRLALRRNMAQSLFEHGKIRTTYPKAKEVRAFVEKLITLSREKTLNNRRRVIQLMQDRRLVDEDQEFTGQTVVQKLFDEIGPRFADRQGGYTRVIKTSDWRIGDGGSIVVLQLLTEDAAPTGTARRTAGLRRKRNERRRLYAGKVLKKDKGEKKAEAGSAAEAGGETAGT
jgi:large subunit ribosomal protein L17